MVAADYQIGDIVLSQSDSSLWMSHNNLSNLRFWFDLDLNNVYKNYWLEVVFEYESELTQPVVFNLESTSLRSALFNFVFYDQQSYESTNIRKGSWEEFTGGTRLKTKVLRFTAFPKDRKKINGDTLLLSGAQIYIGDSISLELPELKYVMNETRSSFLGKKQR